MPIRTPMLEEKLEWLRAERGLLLKDLAKELKTSPQNLSIWVHGTDTTPPNSVPHRYLIPNTDGHPTFCTVFDVPHRAFVAATMEEFTNQIEEFRKSQIEQYPARWTRLVEQAAGAPALQIIGDPTRGVRDPGDPDDTSDPDMPSFSVGDSIMFKVTYPGHWYGLLLMEDPMHRWSCLWPFKNTLDTGFENEFGFPRQTADGPKRFGEVTKPAGLHRVVGIVTKTDGLLNKLRDIHVTPIKTEQLDYLAAELSRMNPNSWVTMAKWFYAGPSAA